MKRGAEGTSPSTNGGNGGDRDARGRFTSGNSGGPGNPHVKAVAAWRSALTRVVSPADIEAVLRKLLECAKAGEPWAIKELLDRCLGKPRAEAERPDGPEQPDTVPVNVELGMLLAQEMRKLSRLPPAPGCGRWGTLSRAPETRQRPPQSLLRHLRRRASEIPATAT